MFCENKILKNKLINVLIYNIPNLNDILMHMVFGQVIQGMDVVKIEECETKSGKPTKKVIIANCGQLV